MLERKHFGYVLEYPTIFFIHVVTCKCMARSLKVPIENKQWKETVEGCAEGTPAFLFIYNNDDIMKELKILREVRCSVNLYLKYSNILKI